MQPQCCNRTTRTIEWSAPYMQPRLQNWPRWIAVCALAVLSMGVIDQITKDALKVKHILRTAERHATRSEGTDGVAEISESELNAYIAYLLAQEKNALISGLRVELLDHNHVQGTVRFDAERLNLSVLLGNALAFEFKGVLDSRNHAVRIDLIAMQVGGQPVKPQVLEFVIDTAARIYRTDVGRIDDWYALPGGIKRIAVSQAKARLYY